MPSVGDLDKERKKLQEKGEVPKWYVTPSWQMFREKYRLNEEDTPARRFRIIAKTLSACLPKNMQEEGNKRFFELMWSGKLAPSSPCLSDVGTEMGAGVSCSGSYVADSLKSFYETYAEIASLSKYKFGTSAYLGDIRPIGSKIRNQGVASGVMPVFNTINQTAQDVNQGGLRRGSVATYLEFEHPDWGLIYDSFFNQKSDHVHFGTNVTDSFLYRLQQNDPGAQDLWSKALLLRCRKGKGYLNFIDKINRLAPEVFKENGLRIRASNLCNEIHLPSDKNHTFTCVLSSLNLMMWDSITDADIQWSVWFLDCLARNFIKTHRYTWGMKKAVRFTEKAMALGLGTLGFHSYLQSKGVSFGSFEAHNLNNEIYSRLNLQSWEASRKIAKERGQPEWCENSPSTPIANATRLAIAPNMSSALLCGGWSQGIEPIFANVYSQDSAAGEILRINPILLKTIRDRGIDTDFAVSEIINDQGSVQNCGWLSDEEKNVFKTAFEINQMDILRLASTRQKYIDQGQSLNLFFSADEDEEYIAEVHQRAAESPRIKGLYYLRSRRGITPSKGECESCEG